MPSAAAKGNVIDDGSATNSDEDRVEFLFRTQDQFLAAYDGASFAYGGVFCPTRKKLPDGTPVVVRVRLGRRRPPLVLSGFVAWRRAGRNAEQVRAGLGIAFALTERPKLAFVLDKTSEGASVKSRRRHERLSIDLPVVWHLEGVPEPLVGTMRDVGRGGAFVRTGHSVSSDAPVVLEVAPPGAAVAMSFSGRVAWIGRNGDDAGFGLEWRARDAGGGRRIKELVRRLSSLSSNS